MRLQPVMAFLALPATTAPAQAACDVFAGPPQFNGADRFILGQSGRFGVSRCG
jgi:hypothetical protein